MRIFAVTIALMVLIGCDSSSDSASINDIADIADSELGTILDPITDGISGVDDLPIDLPAEVTASTDRIFDVINGQAIEEIVAIQMLLNQAEEQGFELLSTNFDNTISNDVDLYACPGGGTVGNSFQSISGPASITTNTADACIIDDLMVTGNFFVNSSSGNGDSINIFDRTTSVDDFTLISTSNNFSITVTNAVLRVRGEFDVGISSEMKSLTDLSVNQGNTNYTVTSAQVTISDSTLPLSGFDDGIDIVIESLVDLTIPDNLNVVTDQPLQFLSGVLDPNPISGVINITGQNANWQIDADGGDEISLLFTVTSLGTTTSTLVPQALYPVEFVEP